MDLFVNILLTILGYVFFSYLVPFSCSLLFLGYEMQTRTCRVLICGVDRYFPGHIHAFYVEYVYYKRRDEARAGVYDSRPAPGVYSERVQRGGYGTMT